MWPRVRRRSGSPDQGSHLSCRMGRSFRPQGRHCRRASQRNTKSHVASPPDPAGLRPGFPIRPWSREGRCRRESCGSRHRCNTPSQDRTCERNLAAVIELTEIAICPSSQARVGINPPGVWFGTWGGRPGRCGKRRQRRPGSGWLRQSRFPHTRRKAAG